jgi:hypothetical protein
VLRKIKESPYVTEEVEEQTETTDLVTREMKKKKMEDVAALEKIRELARGI